MSEPQAFVSNISPDSWQADPDVPGSEMHELMHVDGVWAGLTRFSEVNGPQTWTPPNRETIHVLEGSVRIEIADGQTLELGPGDIASLPAGIEEVWHITAPFKEFWVLSEASSNEK
ncbi:MAG: cupin domain-containing protein [Candidatus Nanopelagicales bacterium]